nr:MAG TPA: hypothetical protein [Caudoviricetes sp.]
MKNFIQKLYEAEIQNTELALAVESISSDMQSMIEKLSNLKVKDLAELIKKLKFDGNVEGGEQLNQSIGDKIDQAIDTLSDIKSQIDNEIVRISQGDMSGDGDSMGNETPDLGDSDMGSDLGGDEDFEEFDADEDYNDSGDDFSDEDLDMSDINFGEIQREKK